MTNTQSGLIQPAAMNSTEIENKVTRQHVEHVLKTHALILMNVLRQSVIHMNYTHL